ncbi:tyrosine decarboxylase [Penicillium canescens]|uniref:Tyrosine decarboxylase n=1 Tax=Penicillium canescens TaxID=5083 RepID=A0AAD6N7G8_PENCN|nr:tyrosine decarboxylase [Penicillium canescens]KAJ6020251.1 tyrosine decarboxylase [Penicillium canescens]KAJ6038660.1 tyrosine decarboxylase [Penicillium canescens]KAJ6045602.1 tyrosine decarboxylase [Penicillium canescens]KAJ6059940.1 tyrosine decarboxylase [Penicillium canescens]KAJ6090828.1 tyrosine decarboxylase [Penicillium canescens]
MEFKETFLKFQSALLEAIESRKDGPVLPSIVTLKQSVKTLPASLPRIGHGLNATASHLINDILPGLSCSSLSPRYYGFITGGCTPAALLADNLVSALDQNVQVHLPQETLATDIELKALDLLKDLVGLDKTWGGTFTSGSSVSNLMAIACGREHVLAKRGATDLGTIGLMEACVAAGVNHFQLLVTRHHPSIVKAANLLGIGRKSIKQVGLPSEPWKIDFDLLETELQASRTASIVSVSCGEVMTGQFGTDGDGMVRLRSLCDKYQAWLHIDAAFGLFASALPATSEFAYLRLAAAGVGFADSITGDGHKLLNVPYDCGFFFSRHPAVVKAVFETPPIAYFATELDPKIPSPLNIGIQNSRRLRALPVYATLVAYGRSGYEDMLARQVFVARAVAAFVLDSPDFELLPVRKSLTKEQLLERVYMLVLFRAKDERLNQSLLRLINESTHAYLSGGMWEDKPAVRMAVSNWRVDVSREERILTKMLQDIVSDWKKSHGNEYLKKTSSPLEKSKI